MRRKPLFHAYWLFAALFIISLIVSITALRHNNLTMTQLRQQLYEADQKNQNVEAALDNLKNYVFAHMNTNLSSGNNTIKPPIQLKYTYQRLQNKEQRRVSEINKKVAEDGQSFCAKEAPNLNRSSCVRDYVSRNGVQPQAIPPALYQFDFVSPTWSPDLAGWSLLASLLLLLAFVLSLFYSRRSRSLLEDI